MKTETTKRMEQALIDKYLQQNKHIALEVPFCHTKRTNFGYGEVGPWEFVDAVSESRGEFTCLELKVSMSDLHSKAAQTFVGNRNYLVCPMKMARKIKDSNDYWLADHPSVGIMGWDGKTTFRVIKQCKPNYLIPDNDWKQLAKGLISSLSKDVRDMRNTMAEGTHEIGNGIADMLEKYGMNSEAGKMLMSEIKTAFDNYDQTYVSFEQEDEDGA